MSPQTINNDEKVHSMQEHLEPWAIALTACEIFIKHADMNQPGRSKVLALIEKIKPDIEFVLNN